MTMSEGAKYNTGFYGLIELRKPSSTGELVCA